MKEAPTHITRRHGKCAAHLSVQSQSNFLGARSKLNLADTGRERFPSLAHFSRLHSTATHSAMLSLHFEMALFLELPSVLLSSESMLRNNRSHSLIKCLTAKGPALRELPQRQLCKHSRHSMPLNAKLGQRGAWAQLAGRKSCPRHNQLQKKRGPPCPLACVPSDLYPRAHDLNAPSQTHVDEGPGGRPSGRFVEGRGSGTYQILSRVYFSKSRFADLKKYNLKKKKKIKATKSKAGHSSDVTPTKSGKVRTGQKPERPGLAGEVQQCGRIRVPQVWSSASSTGGP